LGGTNPAGAVTLSGPLDFAGGNRNLTANNPVVLSGTSLVAAGGVAAKLGAADLTLRSNVVNWISPLEVQGGNLIVDGGVWTNGGSLRTVAIAAGGTTRLVITNGAVVVVTNTVGVLRAGNSNGNGTGTNIFDLAGALMFPNPGAASTDGKVLIGNTCNRGVINLLSGGLLMTRAVQRDATGAGTHDAEFNFDGGTLIPSPGAVGNAFFQGLTEAKVRAGGAVIDTTNQNLTIAQSLFEDPASTGGGLTKLGTGTLLLNGSNSFTGPTLITAGTLGGTGLLTGSLTIVPAAALAPGVGLGVLTVGPAPQLAGTIIMEINPAATPNADRLVVSGPLAYSGALIVTNLGGNPAGGATFDLFDAAAIGGAFSSITLPTLPAGLEWDTNRLASDGILSVIAFAPPVVANLQAETETDKPLVLSAAKVLARCSSPDGEVISLAEVSATSTNGGTVSLAAGQITYTPAAGFTGTDAFSYLVRDARGAQASALVIVTVKNSGGQSLNLVSLSKNGSAAVLSFAGIPGREYLVQTTTNSIPATNWWNVSTNTAGTNGLWTFTDPNATNAIQFYRVRTP
jgi:autotransporter-associated beta strand protein